MASAAPAGLKVVFAASEIAPLIKTGGLGDVAGSLPPALRELGAEVILVMPFYSQVDVTALPLEPSGLTIKVHVGGRDWWAEVWQTRLKGCKVYLLKNDELFKREGLYGDHRSDYPDNPLRFTFFCRGVIELARALNFPARVVHAHDWQTALLPAILETGAWDPGPLAGAATVLTIHNLAYQGRFDRSAFAVTGLPPWMDTPAGAEFWGSTCLLKAGMVTAQAITTVSPSYAQEIQTSEGGWGLDGVLGHHRRKLHGILNGVDYDLWGPAKDKLLPANFSAADLRGKQVCRRELLKAFGLKPAGEGAAVIGFVGRLTPQKGVDLLARVAPKLLLDDVRFCLLGTGDPLFERLWRELAQTYPGRVGVRFVFEEALAHLVKAGSDLLVMPSLFEPCGLNQMYALSYGTPPVVRRVGGLKDTVRQFDPVSLEGTGFTFGDFGEEELFAALREALWTKARPELWSRLQQNGMAQDFSWRKSAQAYLDLYRGLLEGRG